MIAELRFLESSHELLPDPAESRPAFLNRLRQHLDRHDLDDATLEEAVGDVAGRLCDEEAGTVLARLYSGRASANLLRSLVASLCLPAPRAPLAMPVQTLERAGAAALLPRLQMLRVFSRRDRIGER